MTARPAPRIAAPRAIGAMLIGASAGAVMIGLCWLAPAIAAWWRAL
ncbi:hypothetical protein [Sphingomonas solaris]|nr:hypothetical protein [Sphingomonas solaris]